MMRRPSTLLMTAATPLRCHGGDVVGIHERRGAAARVLDGWTVAEVDTFAELLDRFATAVHQHPPHPRGLEEDDPMKVAVIRQRKRALTGWG